MKNLIVALAVAMLVSVVAPANASALYDANLSMKEATLLNAYSDLIDEMSEIAGKTITDAEKFELYSTGKKQLKSIVRADIKAKKSCLKSKADNMKEQRESDAELKIKSTVFTDMVSYNAYNEAMGDYVAAYCMAVKHP